MTTSTPLAQPLRSRPQTWLLPLSAALVLTACQDKADGPPAMPPPEVTIVTVKPNDVPLTLEYVGQTAGSREVEVRARVTGILQKRNYVEGAKVKAGQSLFIIDPAPFEVAVSKAAAKLAQVRIDLAAMKAEFHEKQAEIVLARTRYAFARKDQQRQAGVLHLLAEPNARQRTPGDHGG